MYARALRCLSANSEELAFESMRVGLAHRLAALAKTDGDRLVVQQTHGELAAWIGSQQEEVSRALQRLSRAGLVRLRRYRSGIEILDRASLAAYE